MKSRLLQNLEFRDIRNAVFGTTIVIGGLSLAVITIWAQQTGNVRLAGAAAIASLIFVVLILLFVVPPLARQASAEAAQLDLPVELTSGGWMLIGITVIVGFAAWNTGNNLLFLVLAFLIATVLVSLVLGNLNLRYLEAKVHFPEAIFADQTTVCVVTLLNHRLFLPTFSVTLALRGATSDDPFGGRKFKVLTPPRALARFFRRPLIKKTVGYFVYVPRRHQLEQRTAQVFAPRGRFIIQDFELITGFPFGFWRQRRQLRVRETELYVFPALGDVTLQTKAFGQNGDLSVAQRRGDGGELLGLREYAPGDDVRRVDWRATARTQNLTVREFSVEDEPRATVVFDVNLLPQPVKSESAKKKNETDPRQERFENGVRLAASLVAHLIREQQTQVRLTINDDTGRFGAGKSELYDSLRRLATVTPNNELQSVDNQTENPLINDDNRFDRSELQFWIVPKENAGKIRAQTNKQILTY